MTVRLSGFYIHLPENLPETAEHAFERSMENLSSFLDLLHRMSAESGSALILNNPTIIVRQTASISSEVIQRYSSEASSEPAPSNSSRADAATVGLTIRFQEMPEHPYYALRSLLHRPNLSPEDVEARMETFAFFDGLFPLLDLNVSKDLLERHIEFLSSYTYGENVPIGMAADFVSAEFFELDKQPDTDLRSFAFKNFHELDGEVAFYQPDLRLYRLDFSARDYRSIELCRSVGEALESESSEANQVSLDAIYELIQRRPESIRIAPSYIELELNGQSPVKDRLLLESTGQTLSNTNRASFLSQLDRFLPGDVTVCLGGLGDSGADPGAPEFSLQLLEKEAVKQVYVETYGYNLADWIEYLKSNAKRAGSLNTSSRLVLIVRLCSLRADRYEHFYSGGDLKSVIAGLDQCIQHLSGSEEPMLAVYVEMQKIREVEDEIHDFFQKYDPTPVKPILRKQNTYAGVLEDRKIADLSPPVRGFCWHLARDLYINAEGKVPVCRQDPNARNQSMEIQDLKSAFQGLSADYTKSMQGRHDSVNAPCLKCDEWYLFQG
ncbi:MAG: hypothetical protein CMN76_00305 [Spirochaetaceae bacterium]|nr:hypothetical protein [Spirochaetaceae bacterium]|tara:strand:- start:74028 stop:75683 length:1656 start_codon:yes stop_codon:yes gene_type:complete